MLAHYALQEGGKALEEGLKRKTNKSDEDFVAFTLIVNSQLSIVNLEKSSTISL